MRNRLANNIVNKIADTYRDYFHKHQILDAGDKLRADVREPYLNPSQITEKDLNVLAKHATTLMDKELMKYNLETAKHSAVVLAVNSFADGKYDGKIDGENFYKILNLMESKDSKKTGGIMNLKTAKTITARLDKIADEVFKLAQNGKLEAKYAYNLEMLIDRVSDDIEKQAHKLEGDSDEKYMNDFGNDPATKEHDSDEKYMTDFHNGGQNIMSERYKKDKFHGTDMNKSAAEAPATEKVAEAKPALDAAKLAEKRAK